MSKYSTILDLLKQQGPLTLQQISEQTGYPSKALSSRLWELCQDGNLQLVGERPGLYTFVQPRPRNSGPRAKWTKARHYRRIWTRVYERYGTLYPEHHTRRMVDNVEWALIEEYGYLEEPLGVQSIEVGPPFEGKRAYAPADKPTPWQRTEQQVARDEAQFQMAHTLARKAREARQRGEGIAVLYRLAIQSGIDPDVAVERMGFQSFDELADYASRQERDLARLGPRPLSESNQRWLAYVEERLRAEAKRILQSAIKDIDLYDAIQQGRMSRGTARTLQITRDVGRELRFRRKLLDIVNNDIPFAKLPLTVLGHIPKWAHARYEMMGLKLLTDLMLRTEAQIGLVLMIPLRPLLSRLGLQLPVTIDPV